MAAQGVTPEMIVEAFRLTWERDSAGDDTMPPWEDYLAYCNTRRGRDSWLSNLERWTPEAFGDDEKLCRKVAAVVQAVIQPPNLLLKARVDVPG